MTTAAFAHVGATPLLALPSSRRDDATRNADRDLAPRTDGPHADWAKLIDTDILVAPTEIWLQAPLRVMTTNYTALLDDACEGFRTSGNRTFRAASRSVKGTYGNELLRSMSASECSVIYISGMLADDVAASATVGNLTVAYPRDDSPSVVETIAALARRLDVTESVIYRAAGIKGRTFKHWKKKPDTVPRPDSLGTLWSLASAVDDLAEHLVDDTPARWLRARTERFSALKEGLFRQLVDESLGLLTVSPESTAHRDSLVLIEEAQSIDARTQAAVEPHSWVLDEETPTKVVLD